MRRHFSTLFLLITVLSARPSAIDNAFKALSIYDYFKAKDIFYKQVAKHPVEAGYGLATIFFRNDNPFHQLDSAFKYIDLSKNHYSHANAGFRTELKNKYGISDSALALLHDSVCYKAYLRYLRKPGEQSAENYLKTFYTSAYARKIMCIRDSFVFHKPDRKLTVEGFRDYLYTYPQSCFLNDVRNLLEFAIYMETTADKNDKSYLAYITKYPKGKYIPYAKEELLNYYIKSKNATGIYGFIQNYGGNYPTNLAWNMLLGIEAPHHSKGELEAFLEKYSDYPKREEILEEFNYWQTPFFLIHKNDKLGYCDSTGKQMIEPLYTDAEDFNEGYAVAQKNDLYGYINKAGKTKIEFQYTEASGFNNNVAIVQKDKKYFLIDYSNKVLSARYDDIADFSEGMAIVKKNNQFGAINQNGQEIIKPAFDMISDFSEGFAVFLKSGKYGFLDKQGFVAISPIYDWVSSFKDGQCRAQYNKLFGVINKKGDFIIQPAFDLIDEENKGIYLLMKNNLYGFADSSGCMLTEIKYVYQPSYKTAMLTDGKFLRLFTSKRQELQNLNGARYFTDRSLDEVSLPVNNFVVATEKGKYSLYNITKPAFAKKSLISAFSDGSYWYIRTKKGLTCYDLSLERSFFTIEADKAVHFYGAYFLTENEEGKGLMDINGVEIVAMKYDEIRPTSLPHILYLTRNEKGAYFNISARTFTWKEDGFDDL